MYKQINVYKLQKTHMQNIKNVDKYN